MFKRHFGTHLKKDLPSLNYILKKGYQVGKLHLVIDGEIDEYVVSEEVIKSTARN
jgi:hypothetical protein